MFNADSLIVSSPISKEVEEALPVDVKSSGDVSVLEVKEENGHQKKNHVGQATGSADKVASVAKVKKDKVVMAQQVGSDSLGHVQHDGADTLSTQIDTLKMAIRTPKISWEEIVAQNADSTAISNLGFGKDTVSGKIYVDKSVYNDRIAGEPNIYLLRNDDFVVSALLLLYVACLFVTTRANRYFVTAVKHFFERKRHNTIFEDSNDTQMQGRSLLIFQTAVAQGLLMNDYLQETMIHPDEKIPALVMLGLNIVICSLWVWGKLATYNCVNRAFFSADKRRAWMDGYLLLQMCYGLVLMPVAILSLYNHVESKVQVYFVILVSIIVEILLICKAFRTFFTHKLGYLHLILYFCALEIVPTILFWRISVYTNHLLNIL